jgi:hypothetical protein
VDVETIATALLVIGAFASFLVLLRRLPPSDDDVAVVVASIVRSPVEIERPPADLEEPGRWRLDLLRPRAADRSKRSDFTKPLTAATRVFERQSIARTSIGSPTLFSVSARDSESE